MLMPSGISLHPEGHGRHTVRGLSSVDTAGGLQNSADSGNLTTLKPPEAQDRSGVSAAALLAVDLPAKRAEALRWVTAHPGRSARELERLSGLRKINARLSELEAQGVVEGRSYTTCSVTGRVATAWRPTGNAPRPLPHKTTARQRIAALTALAERLEAENAQLRAKLAATTRGQLDLPVWAEGAP